MNKVVLIAAALVLAPLALWGQEVQDRKDRESLSDRKGSDIAAPSERAGDSSQLSFRDRVAEAVEAVEDACAADVDDFCGNVTPGGGRIAFCILANEDQLGGRCRVALRRAASNLQRSVDRVAEGCWNEVQAACGEGGRIAQCLEQKKGSLSSSCRTIVEAVGHGLGALTPLVGMSVFSSDNKDLGRIVNVMKGPDNKIQSIQVDIGRLLGIGTKVVTITGDKIEQLPRIKLSLSDADVRSLPEAKTQ
ncbi:MAG TPA: PRC-barrel domain-containing protein [Hyphomicrobiaceae bacterium]|jgi:hypothetical protein